MHIFKLVWNKWKAFAKIIAIFQARVIFTLFYFTILAPFGLFFSLLKDELKLHHVPKTILVDKRNQSETMEEMRRQF